jgi:hypothetical protein
MFPYIGHETNPGRKKRHKRAMKPTKSIYAARLFRQTLPAIGTPE